MKVLFIGGTGIISTACTELCAQRGIELTILNRGRRPVQVPQGVSVLTGDVEDAEGMSRLLSGTNFDSVVDWIAFTPNQVERDIELFRGRTRQYIFISSASAYQKPPTYYLTT